MDLHRIGCNCAGSRDWSAAAEQQYWSSVSDKVQDLYKNLQALKQASGKPETNGAAGSIEDPRPYPSSPEHVIWIGMSAWEVNAAPFSPCPPSP